MNPHADQIVDRQMLHATRLQAGDVFLASRCGCAIAINSSGFRMLVT